MSDAVSQILNATPSDQSVAIRSGNTTTTYGPEFVMGKEAFGPPFTASGSDGAIASGLLTSFADQLRAASWRGQPFAVLDDKVRAGRRKAIHEYPFRDGAWVEDMGKRGRVYGFTGFVIGDDVGDQVKGLVDKAEAAGPGELVHPTFGRRQCELLDFDAGESWDEGRVWRFRMEFLDPVPRGLQLQPAAVQDTQSAVRSAAGDADGASSQGFLDKIGAGLGSGLRAAQQAVAAVQPYVAAATRLAGDASRIVGLVSRLSGGFGRYSGGRGGTTFSSVQGALRTVQQVRSAVAGVIGTATAARSLVLRTGADLSALVSL